MIRRAMLGLVAVSSVLLSACVVAPYGPPRAVVYSQPGYQQAAPVYSQAPGQPYMVAPMAPPPVYQEVIPVRPFADALWIAGFWGWVGGRYIWNGGHWDHHREGHEWEPHRWVPHGNEWHMEGGRWRQR
jgi:hypothetical protein